MSSAFLRATALLLATAAPAAIAEHTLAGISECAAISSPLDRLECYDALARSMPVAAKPPPPAPAPIQAPAKAPAPAPTVAPERPAPEPQPVAVQPPADAPTSPPAPESAPADFGFENERLKKDQDAVVANYDGEFTGWSGGTLFKLDNGQVWKQAQSGRVSYRKDRPKITISRGAFGSYRLKVEGLNRTVRVKRIK